MAGEQEHERNAAALRLKDLTGVVEYRVAGGDRIAKAVINTRVLYARPEDTTYPHPYRNALNEAGWHISVTQRALDAGEVWPVDDEPGPIIAAYNTRRWSRDT
jgi:hypothetical protein